MLQYNQKKSEIGNPKSLFFDIKTKGSDCMKSELEEYLRNHKKLLESKEKELMKIPVIINAYGGPGAGKSVACMDICAELKKRGYNAEYVQEYAKELVYDGRLDLLDGSERNQWDILKEQLYRVDRLYESVDFVVTDSPILLNIIYNRELTAEYESVVTQLYNQMDNFSFFVKRDMSHFQQEGRIQNFEESIEKDKEIETLLNKNGIYYGIYTHKDISKVVNNSIKTFERINKSNTVINNKINKGGRYMQMRILEMYVDKNSEEHFENGGKLANATVEIDELFIINNVRLMQGKNGLFVSMPSNQNSKGEYQNIAYFTGVEEREQLAIELGREYMKRTGIKIPQAEKIDVNIFLIDRGNQKGYATVTIDEKMKITGIRVIEGKKGLFVSMPELKDSKGEYHDVIRPASKRAYEAIQEAILGEYNKISLQKGKAEELKSIENDIEGSILSQKVNDLEIPQEHMQEKSINMPDKEHIQEKNVKDREEKTEKEAKAAPAMKR